VVFNFDGRPIENPRHAGYTFAMHTAQFDVQTKTRDQMIDITERVAREVSAAQVRDGLALVYVPHTTAGVTINENADPDVIHDVLAALDRAVPWRQEFYRHGEGNSAAHAKSSMVGCSAAVPIHAGRLALGTWQGIYFCEFDGPRTRQAIVTVIGA
jgi:secondary thiamine-phosphate synthase enzyme